MLHHILRESSVTNLMIYEIYPFATARRLLTTVYRVLSQDHLYGERIEKQ